MEAEGLFEEGICAGCEGFFPEITHCADHDNTTVWMPPPPVRQDVEAYAVGQVIIEKNHVRMSGLELFKPFCQIIGIADVRLLSAKEASKEQTQILFIIDDQYFHIHQSMQT